MFLLQCIGEGHFLPQWCSWLVEHSNFSPHNHMDTCLLVEGNSEIQCCSCLIHNACIYQCIAIPHTMQYWMVVGPWWPPEQSPKIDNHNDHTNHHEKGKNATTVGFASHFNTTTNHSNYLQLWGIKSTPCEAVLMLLLDHLKAHILFGMILGEMWKNATNCAFSCQNLTKLVYSSIQQLLQK